MRSFTTFVRPVEKESFYPLFVLHLIGIAGLLGVPGCTGAPQLHRHVHVSECYDAQRDNVLYKRYIHFTVILAHTAIKEAIMRPET